MKKDEKESESEAASEVKEKAKEKKEKLTITRDMTLGEVIRKYPASAAVMMEYGLHCIGCHVAEWETIEQGCQAHGLSKEDLDKLMDDLNKPAVLEGKLVFDEEEAVEETKEEKMEKEKKGFFRRLHP